MRREKDAEARTSSIHFNESDPTLDVLCCLPIGEQTQLAECQCHFAVTRDGYTAATCFLASDKLPARDGSPLIRKLQITEHLPRR